MSTSGYNIEVPSANSFKMLFLMSVAVLSLFEVGTNSIGLVVMVWGVFTALRCVWLMETMLKSKPGTVRGRLLPWVILNGMAKRQRTILAKQAYRIFNWPFLLWFICAAFFLIGTLTSTLVADLPDTYLNTQSLIENFFIAEGLSSNLENSARLQAKLITFAQLALIGMAFFVAHSYAYTDYKSDRIWWGPFFLFVLLGLSYALFFGFDFSRDLIPQDQKLFMYLAGALSVWVFVHAWRRSPERTKYAQLGLSCLLIMFLTDQFVALPSYTAPFWFAGWVSVSILWVRALGDESKKYLLYKI